MLILAPARPASAAGQISPVLTGLHWPIALGFSSDGRVFYDERYTGSIRIIENGTLLPTPFITLPGTDGSGERGLLGLALDPGFPSSPYLYAYQTYNDTTNGTVYNRIVRIHATGDVGDSYSVILRLPALSSQTIHNGGVIAFGPDGKLYAVVGENYDPAHSQDPLSPMGKVLRMNSDGSVPTDNPFYGNSSWYQLVYTYGHRNMFGIAFHPFTGRVFITENGPACNDEINILTPGRNYGWGTKSFNNNCTNPPPAPNNTNQDGPNPVLPIWWWGRTICPTNAAIYAGPYFPTTWQGDLFIGDCNFYHFHRLHLVPPDYTTVASDDILWTAPALILDVEEGLDGAIWITTPSAIYRYWDSRVPPVALFTATPNPVNFGATVAFDASASYDSNGTITSYAWNFGDSTTGTGVTASHLYASPGTFNVSLVVTDNGSYAGKAYHTVKVRAPPVAAFTITPNPATTGQSVTFNASGSSDPDGTIVSFSWDFGDHSTGSGALTTHPYAAAGTYNVSLALTDNNSQTATTSHQVVVKAPPPGPRPPVADFSVNPSPVNPGFPVSFNASASHAINGTIVSYTWLFGDGATGSGVMITHTYPSSGVFSVILAVVDNRSLSSNATHQVRVNAPPHAAFQFAPTTVYEKVNVTFDGTASADPDGMVVSYSWNFGDGRTGAGSRVRHAYASKGVFAVELNVTDDGGLSNRTVHLLDVRDRAPEILSSAPGAGPVTVVAGTAQAFSVVGYDPDGDVLTYVWRVDGAVVGGNSTTLNFYDTVLGAHSLNVTVSDGSLTASRAWDVTVVPNPTYAFLSSWPFLTFIAVVIVAVAVGLLLRRRRRTRRNAFRSEPRG